MSTITLKNVPVKLHHALKKRAELHRRSLNNEILSCLEQITPRRLSGAEEKALLKNIREHREKMGGNITDKEIEKAKNWGRE